MNQAGAFGDSENGQPLSRVDRNGEPIHKIMVAHNHLGDVMIIRHGEKVAWLDMSRDVAGWLAIELIEHAQMDKLALAAALLSDAPRETIS